MAKTEISIKLRPATLQDFVIEDVSHCQTCGCQKQFKRALFKDFWVLNSKGELEHYTIKANGDYTTFKKQIANKQVFVIE